MVIAHHHCSPSLHIIHHSPHDHRQMHLCCVSCGKMTTVPHEHEHEYEYEMNTRNSWELMRECCAPLAVFPQFIVWISALIFLPVIMAIISPLFLVAAWHKAITRRCKHLGVCFWESFWAHFLILPIMVGSLIAHHPQDRLMNIVGYGHIAAGFFPATYAFYRYGCCWGAGLTYILFTTMIFYAFNGHEDALRATLHLILEPLFDEFHVIHDE